MTLPFQFEPEFSDDENTDRLNESEENESEDEENNRGRLTEEVAVMLFTDEWVKCDDDKISLITSEEILKLSGGGDWHCAYVLLYGPRIYEFDEDEGTKMDTS
ncbi:Ubiquitin carboxyl-terminal hydrolase 14 [Nymphon striatum]|nr:Ubiquitin carboxyl-terminal hydrolase 14 [Nymphon striatum]